MWTWILRSLKTKKGITAIVGIVGALSVWGVMKYQDWQIDNLREDLMIEQIERESAEGARSDREAADEVTEQILSELLDEQQRLREQTTELRESLRADVSELQGDWSERRAEIEREFEEDNGDESYEKTLILEMERFHHSVGERVIDGMWESYCHTVADDSRCPE